MRGFLTESVEGSLEFFVLREKGPGDLEHGELRLILEGGVAGGLGRGGGVGVGVLLGGEPQGIVH